MSPGDFLRSVWPSEGTYCLATPFKGGYSHKVCETISDAVSFVLQQRASRDIFFAVHTLKEASVWDPNKLDWKTGEKGAKAVRTQPNMAMAKCFFFDIDVGAKEDKYDTQEEARAALDAFVKTCELPPPLVASSGGGLHVYWLIEQALDSAEWRPHAAKLRQLARHYGLKVDGTRTTDVSSVLRVVGTSNWKDRSKPREVTVLDEGERMGTGAFIKLVDDALTKAGMVAKALPPLVDFSDFGNNTTRDYEGPPVSIGAVSKACAQMRRLILTKGDCNQSEWYFGMIGVGRFLKNGEQRVHQMSAGGPTYSKDATDTKIQQHINGGFGPTSCGKLVEVSNVGDEPCVGCPHAGRVHGPLQAARFHEDVAPPIKEELIGSTIVVTEVPPAPKPYVRLPDGGIAIKAKNNEGEEVYTIIYPYDLYPIRRLVNVGAQTEQQLWHVDLPRGDAKEFVLDADSLYDPRKFMVAIAHQGIYPHKSHIALLQDYMVAYISELQRLSDADAQCSHLGWTDERTRFIFPDKIMLDDGTARPAMLSLGAQRASAHVHKKGTLEEQVRLLRFYARKEYLPNQFYILASLAAPIFFATGHHGVIVNASGDAGASKSTSLYTAASFWGQPELYPINGTNNGATVRGRNERVTVLANLPICVDEITHMPVRDAVDLAMSITQPGHRIRLQTDGQERAAIESYKATIMLTTANNSFHGMLSENNAAGTAGSMRVFEISFKATGVHEKYEADEFLHALKENFGHLGEAFVAHVLRNLNYIISRVRQITKEIDVAANIKSSERFWSALIATVLVAAEVSQELGLLNYDAGALRRWALDYQIPYMRGVVAAEYTDPLSTIADYLAKINANIIVMEKIAHNQANLVAVRHPPRGELLAHYDMTDQMIYVLKKGFKDHCARIGSNSLKIINELHALPGEKIIANPDTRRVLGAGSEYAGAQVWCFALNMNHPEVSGAVDLKLIVEGEPQPKLTVVKSI